MVKYFLKEEAFLQNRWRSEQTDTTIRIEAAWFKFLIRETWAKSAEPVRLTLNPTRRSSLRTLSSAQLSSSFCASPARLQGFVSALRTISRIWGRAYRMVLSNHSEAPEDLHIENAKSNKGCCWWPQGSSPNSAQVICSYFDRRQHFIHRWHQISTCTRQIPEPRLECFSLCCTIALSGATPSGR